MKSLYFILLIIPLIFCRDLYTQPIVSPEITFFVIIPTYNNASRCIANIESVAMQEYPYWIAYIVDDCSTDGTADILQAYIDEHQLHDKIILIRNKDRCFALENIYRAVHTWCQDEWVVVFLDGDDKFAQNHVFERLIVEYQKDAWVTYGQFMQVPKNLRGGAREFPSDVIKYAEFRNYEFISTHLRTCKGWLFKMIKVEDLLHDSKFYSVGWDVALMFPMLEMSADGHIRFIPDVLYLYTVYENNDHKHSRQKIYKSIVEIRGKKKYKPLTESVVNRFKKMYEEKVDLVIFSYDRPLQLYALLESVERYITGLATIIVICRMSTDVFDKAYQEVQKKFPYVQFIKQSGDKHKEDFKSLLLKTFKVLPSNYSMFAVDDLIVKDFINLPECIQMLEKTFAYGFYLRLGEHITYCYTKNKEMRLPPFIRFDNFLVWQFNNGSHDWAYPYSLDMTLYRKEDILIFLEQMSFTTPNKLENCLSDTHCNGEIGICFNTAKVVNIPCNMVNESSNKHMHEEAYTQTALLEKFNQNLKFDIDALRTIKNKSAHIEMSLPFIER
ncbi:MAG: glycosyltransferase family 2 protein [Candidatus Babeliaceae bacterium]